jgi:hypothetical protein
MNGKHLAARAVILMSVAALLVGVLSAPAACSSDSAPLKAVYDLNWQLRYYLKSDALYNMDWQVRYYLRDDSVYDKRWIKRYYVKDNELYDWNWQLRYYIREYRASGDTREDTRSRP